VGDCTAIVVAKEGIVAGTGDAPIDCDAPLVAVALAEIDRELTAAVPSDGLTIGPVSGDGVMGTHAAEIAATLIDNNQPAGTPCGVEAYRRRLITWCTPSTKGANHDGSMAMHVTRSIRTGTGLEESSVHEMNLLSLPNVDEGIIGDEPGMCAYEKIRILT
jgi:hypothetical protein